MQRDTSNERFWRDRFRLTDDDRELLLDTFMTQSQPLDVAAMAHQLIENRVGKEEKGRTPVAGASSYQPSSSYQTGDQLVFPSLGGMTGKVVSIRPGKNPRYDAFKVLQVELDSGGAHHEFVAEFRHTHALNLESDVDAGGETLTLPEIEERFGFYVRQRLEQELAESNEFVRFGSQWLPSGLLVEINEGHRNIAEAMVDITGDALPTPEVLKEMGLPGNVARPISEFSINYALSQDRRFRNVGTSEKPRWHLTRLLG
jgi:hypothetical protein